MTSLEAGEITPVNITSAMLITQLGLAAMVVVGAILLQRADRDAGSSTRNWSVIWPTTVVLVLLSLGCLVAADEFAGTWRPLFGGSPITGLSWSRSILIVFLADIVGLSVLVALSGGSQGSPFVPMFFILPPLAFFVRESPTRVFLYALIVGLAFTWLLRVKDDGRIRSIGSGYLKERPVPKTLAYWWVAMASFGLATLVGWITRPI